MVTLIKKTLNWGGSRTFSEVQPIITMTGSTEQAVRCGAGTEPVTPFKQQEVEWHSG